MQQGQAQGGTGIPIVSEKIGTGDPRDIFAPGLFKGRTAVVTGGAKGVGHATAIGFARYGADVVIASRDERGLEAARAEIEALGAACLAVVVDIRDVASVDRLFDATMDRFGRVDCLINNAGGQFMAHPYKISDNGWRSVVDLNLNGTWNVISRFMRPMVKAGTGSIVNMIHIFCSDRGAPMFVHSGAARSGVIGMTKSLAPYLEHRGVTINAIAPGTVATESAAANYGRSVEDLRASTKRFRCGTPEDLAAIMMFLCSPAGRMINGTVVTADATQTQHNWSDRVTDDLFDEALAFLEQEHR